MADRSGPEPAGNRGGFAMLITSLPGGKHAAQHIQIGGCSCPLLHTRQAWDVSQLCRWRRQHIPPLKTGRRQHIPPLKPSHSLSVWGNTCRVIKVCLSTLQCFFVARSCDQTTSFLFKIYVYRPLPMVCSLLEDSLHWYLTELT